MGVFRDWDRQMIKDGCWVRFTIDLKNRAEGREVIKQIKTWFAEHGIGKCMVTPADYSRYATVAFSNDTDCVLFRLTFSEVSMWLVPQPHAHETYKIGGK